MTSSSHYTRFSRLKQRFRAHFSASPGPKRATRPPLNQLARRIGDLPPFVQESPVALRYLRLLGDLDWSRFPERDLSTPGRSRLYHSPPLSPPVWSN